MKCEKCGKRFQGNFCPYCGTKAEEKEVVDNISSVEENKSFISVFLSERFKMILYVLPVVSLLLLLVSLKAGKVGAAILFLLAGVIVLLSFRTKEYRKKQRRRFVGVAIFYIAFFIMFLGIKGEEENEKILNRLSQFATIEADEERKIVTFDFNYGYKLRYVDDLEANEFLIFNDYEIYNCLYEYFWVDDIGNEGDFTYDLSDKEFRIYTNFDTRDGRLSILQYDTESGEYTVMTDDGWYDITDDFRNHLDTYDLVGTMQSSYYGLEEALARIQISMGDISSLTYKSVNNWLRHKNIEEININANELFDY